MSEVGHDLHAFFPDDGDILHDMKVDDAQFRELSERYHRIEREIDRIESGLDAASDDRLEALKRQRLDLLDSVAARVAARRRSR